MKTMKSAKAAAPPRMKAAKKAAKAAAPPNMKAMKSIKPSLSLTKKQQAVVIKNEKWVHIDSRNVKECWIQLFDPNAKIKVWKLDI